MSKNFKILITAVVIIFTGTFVYFSLEKPFFDISEITNFEECEKAGYPVGESYPRQCWTPDGKHFVEDISKDPMPSPGLITISGEITCLPKIGTGAQTLECAIGLLGEDNRYYGLRNLFENDPQGYLKFGTGAHVQITGTFQSETMTGPDGNKYDISGIIEVEKIELL